MKIVAQLAAPIAFLFLFACSSTPRPPASKGASLLVTRAFLVSGFRELPGYGAYSYVLLPKDPAENDRYIALLKAFLALPRDQPVDPVGQSTPLSWRNITYVPVTQDPGKVGAQLDWLLTNYDVPRAASILRSQSLTGEGPYIATFVAPLSTEQSRVDIAVVDLSHVPKESMEPWMRCFTRASQEPNDWARNTAAIGLLKLHDLLKNLHDSTELTIKAMAPVGKIAQAFGLTSGASAQCHAAKP